MCQDAQGFQESEYKNKSQNSKISFEHFVIVIDSNTHGHRIPEIPELFLFGLDFKTRSKHAKEKKAKAC